QPEEVAYAFEKLSAISDKFTVAAAFGNVHGVYKPGNVKLQPVILQNSQDHIREKFNITADKPVNFVFHGGSGSSPAEIKQALSNRAIKMDIDTDMQWELWDGIREYYSVNEDSHQAQIGKSKDADARNKKSYDPCVWLG